MKRFPGLKSFEKEEQKIFFGRDTEIEYLSEKIKENKITLIYSKSGIGKTSLVKAGVVPLLDSEFEPVFIRFQKNKLDLGSSIEIIPPFEIFKSQVQEAISNSNDISKLSFWHTLRDFESKFKKKLLFIFDQFEELFQYNDREIDDFGIKLSELFSDKPPLHIQNILTETPINQRTQEFILSHSQIKVKAIFILRSDKLNELHKLKNTFLNIFHNEYILKPLTFNQAIECLTKPTQLNGNFESPKFNIKPENVELIINKILGKNNNEIDSSQLQIIASYIENRVINSFLKGVEKEDWVLREDEINVIITDFYYNQISSFEDISIRNKVEILLEDLVSKGTRTSLTEQQIIDKVSEDVIEKLIDLRLIKQEFTHLGKTYELSHDVLTNPIENQKKKKWLNLENERQREEINRKNQEIKEKKQSIKYRNIFIGVMSVILLAGIVASFISWRYFSLKERAIELEEDLKNALKKNEKFDPCETMIANGIYFFKEGKYLTASTHFANAKFLFDEKIKHSFSLEKLDNLIYLCNVGNEANNYFYDGELKSAIKNYQEIYDFEKKNKKFLDRETSFAYIQIANSDYAINVFNEFNTKHPDPSKVFHISLEGKNLYTLPIEFQKYYNLKTLSLRDNKIQKIPKVVFLFHDLVVLNLNENQITEINPSLSNLKNLTDLSLNNNNISEIPVQVLNFPNLKYLVLRGNNIKFLKGFKSLEKLNTLVIDNNPIESIDSNFYKIPSVNIQTKTAPFFNKKNRLK